jgi:hypothetical protein
MIDYQTIANSIIDYFTLFGNNVCGLIMICVILYNKQ